LDYRIAANYLESAGDYIADFSSAVSDIFHTRLIDLIMEVSMLVEKMQDRSVAAFTSKNGSESIEVVKMYNKFNEVLNSIKELSAKMESKNQESTIAVLNLIYSMDKIARCWVDIADLVKPVYLTAPLRNL
jgi:uncharacterized protein with PhoU and TrkA domain